MENLSSDFPVEKQSQPPDIVITYQGKARVLKHTFVSVTILRQKSNFKFHYITLRLGGKSLSKLFLHLQFCRIYFNMLKYLPLTIFPL